MIFDTSEFVFKAPPIISRSRRVLIKPCASSPVPYPASSSREILATIIRGIRHISDADILILEGTPDGSSIQPVYQALGYNFPRVLTLDIRDCILVEVENPLPKALVVPSFWIPNVILSSDYLITVAPPRVFGNMGYLSITNLLTVLPASKYGDSSGRSWGALRSLGIDKVIADLYFTLPFDLGIVEARQMLVGREDDPTRGEVKECGKTFIGEPYEVDCEAAEALGIKAKYLDLIREAKAELATQNNSR